MDAPKLGTIRQADTLVMLVNKVRASQGKPVLTVDEANTYRARVLGMTQPEVQVEFQLVNDRLGFDRHLSPASAEQRRILWRLERAAYGRPQHDWSSPLTYAEASDLIARVIRDRNLGRVAATG